MNHTNQGNVNICRYQVRAGHEAEMERLLAEHWPVLRKAGLASEEPARVYRGLPPEGPNDQHGAARVYIEILAWAQPNGPQIAHETPEVMAVWEPMGAICESMDFPLFEPVDLAPKGE